MENQRAKITKRSVDAVAIPSSGEVRLWDTELKGFFLRVYPTGRRVYALKYRFGPLQRILTIGVHGSPFNPETARDAAEKALRSVADGVDPALVKQAARTALTVADLIDRYLDDGPATKPAKRASTWVIDRSNLNRHVRPLLGRRIANSLTKAEAAKAVKEIADGKTALDVKTGIRGRAIVKGGAGTARRTKTTAAAMYSWAMEHGLADANPFASIRMTAPPVKERFLSKSEAANFLQALADLERKGAVNSEFADAIRLLLLTGARKTEVLGLRWCEVDFERKLLRLPPERTKAGGRTGERRIVLSSPALQILARRRHGTAAPGAFVFTSSRGDGHIVGVRRAFAKVTAAANLDGLRVHDLRHSFASFAVADGASLFLVGKLLGHASARTTERYAHLSGDPLQDAADAIGKRLLSDQDASTGEVIEIGVSR